MSIENYLSESLVKAHQYCVKEDFKGYSLYDSHNSYLPFLKMGKTISFFANQIIKRSQINFRPFLGIKKEYNPKGIGLFLNIYSQAKDLGLIDENERNELCHRFFSWLVENSSKGYHGHCWGYNYDWPNRDGSYVSAYTPSGVVTGFICRAIMNYYRSSMDQKVLPIIKSAADFIVNDLIQTDTKYGLCFSYTPVQRFLTINANLLAVEVLAYADHIMKESKYMDIIKSVIDFTVKLQNEDGSWYYSFHPKTFEPKKQIDFHQGYVIETMANIISCAKYLDTNEVHQSIKKGFAYYLKRQLSEEGFAFWRYPKKWPIDIHNQSQAIITLTRFAYLDENSLALAVNIAEYTLNNMFSKHGAFYYQKWPFFVNKTPYMRWNQAWSMLALLELYKKCKNV